MKKILLSFLFIFLVTFIIGNVSAACVAPYTGMIITQSTQLCNPTAPTDSITIGANNIVVECAPNVNFYKPTGGTLFIITGKKGVTIKNCWASKYNEIVRITNSENIVLQDNKFEQAFDWAIVAFDSKNIQVLRNNLSNNEYRNGVHFSKVIGGIIQGNTINHNGFNGGWSYRGGIALLSSSNIIISNNIMQKNKISIYISGSSGTSISGNSVCGSTTSDPYLTGSCTEGTWFIQQTQSGYVEKSFGWKAARSAPADFDGDGKADLAVFCPTNCGTDGDATWFIQQTRDGLVKKQYGWSKSIPTPADFDGDGKADLTVYDASKGEWYINQTRDGFVKKQFGWSAALAVPADFDGDGKADLAVFCPTNCGTDGDATWFIQQTRDGFVKKQFGWSAALAVPADFDGDGKADLVVFDPAKAEWYINQTRDGLVKKQYGWSKSIPTPADFDGDGKADLTVYDQGFI